jgi:hypothetical protein
VGTSSLALGGGTRCRPVIRTPSIPIKDVCLQKKVIIIEGLLFLVMSILDLHIELDQLETGATP